METLNDVVEAEINSFPVDVRANLLKIVRRIESIGLELVGEPYAKHIEGKIWELRPHGRNVGGRCLYVTARQRRVIILVAFVKKSDRTPRRYIELAKHRMMEIAP
ncbi:MAG: type II toxin-antitoxin system RelE/ParE family toxin [Dongiaceae bacterium]